MRKKVLSETDLYYGEVKMPKGFDIDRIKIKNDIINSYFDNKKISNNPKDYAHSDYQIPFSQPLQWLQDYLRDHIKADYDFTLIPKLNWANVLEYNQKTFTRNTVDPVDLINSPDYTLIYGVDISEDKETGIVIEYDDNRRKGRTWHVPLKSNQIIMFPSINKDVIAPNKSKGMNIFLTMTYEYI